MRIRDATDTDIPAITDIVNQAIPAGNTEWVEELHTPADRMDWLTDRQQRGFPVVVADTGDAVVGLASYAEFREPGNAGAFRFTVEHSIYLDRAARGSGAAGALMDELVARARAAGLRQMVATIDATNPASLRFHERYGFVETGRMPDIAITFDTWRTMVIMQLDLRPERS